MTREPGRAARALVAATPWLLSAGLALVYGPAIVRSSLLQGDLPGHLEAIRWSAEHVWPLAWGWDPRYLGGAPIGILYPPLLTWIGAALAQVVSAESALRVLLLVSVAALPPALVVAARGLGLRRGEAACAAMLALAVLWLPGRGLGGSLHQSLVTGNAANALALPWLLLFVGRVRVALARPDRLAAAAVPLAVTLLAHMLVGAVAGVTLVAYTLAALRRRGRRALARGVAVAALALATAAPFLLPFVVHLREASPDAIAYNPPPTAPEWIALALLGVLLAVAGKGARRALVPAAAILAALYLCRGVLFPLLGTPDVRMEYHRFRLYLYLALAPAVVLVLRVYPRTRPVTAGVGIAAAGVLVALGLFAAHDARGPDAVPMPVRVPDLGGERIAVLASPEAQNGSWHGLQLTLPGRIGAHAVKGLFVESAPLARRVFELERALASPDARPRWWGIRTAATRTVRSWTAAEVDARCAELGVGWVLAREPVADVVRQLAVARPLDLGSGFTLVRLRRAPLAVTTGPERAGVATRVSADASRVALAIPAGAERVRVRIAAFSDWRVASGEATLGRADPGILEVAGRGEVELRVRPRLEEWLGLAVGLAGVLALALLARRERIRRRAAGGVSAKTTPGVHLGR